MEPPDIQWASGTLYIGSIDPAGGGASWIAYTSFSILNETCDDFTAKDGALLAIASGGKK